MATQTATPTTPKQDVAIAQQVQELREIFADAPEMAKTALERALPTLASLGSGASGGSTESAGRIGIRQGTVSELTVIAPFAPGGAKRLRQVLRLLKGNFSAATKSAPYTTCASSSWTTTRSFSSRLPTMASGIPISRTSRRRSPRNGRHLLRVRGLAGDSEPEGERLDRRAPDPRGRLVCRPSGSVGGRGRASKAHRQGR